MKIISLFFALLCLSSCHTSKQNTESKIKYVPDDQSLYDTIMKLDNIFFNAYNTCNVNLDKYASFYADDVEFYHDKGGVMKSKTDIVESTRKNVCGRVTRRLIPGTVEVYPIANYGAIEIGFHTFSNNSEKPVSNPHPGRFVIIWRQLNNNWQITRVISLH